VAAARQAEADSGLDVGKEADRVGAAIATGIGGLKSYQDCYDTLIQRGPDRVNPAGAMLGMIAGIANGFTRSGPRWISVS